jgi:1-acyl-sn-glycerol-3-phosphate acyltransferase
MSRETAETDLERRIAATDQAIPEKRRVRNLALLGLLAAPWLGFLAVALRPSPRQMWAQRWPTITFVGLYQIALDRCVTIEGLEHLPTTGPVILAGNHINRTAMDAMLMGSKILVARGSLAKFVSQADPPDRMLKRFVQLLGDDAGVILPIQEGMTTDTMIRFLRNPDVYKRDQPILGIFPAGAADADFETHMNRPWHTSAAVAASETGAAIIPFFVDGLPDDWGPFDMLKAVARPRAGGKAFEFKVRLGPPIRTASTEKLDHVQVTERVRQAVIRLATDSNSLKG